LEWGNPKELFPLCQLVTHVMEKGRFTGAGLANDGGDRTTANVFTPDVVSFVANEVRVLTEDLLRRNDILGHIHYRDLLVKGREPGDVMPPVQRPSHGTA
jgi:hypothetical protein